MRRSLLQRRARGRAAVQPLELPERGIGQIGVFLGDGES
jgi:hypothetical protein